ncbi:enoyl-CoA hydratase/isomerase family protein [Candidatus Berkiella cookevillensis]|uniref:enoyl-CoA hydratase n=2 Tax=Candidatus Berkiella cookevillensis TaxID=437022 RepID=A0AAE3HQ50_9GAMM|nr:3-hydroxyacyl-CoA dehydrogenase NAD-binding domain-containing protein [Candidatus Berkiella cookevillensis]MCS5708025.1 enoyl-CoA hydratase/isomerase family protein [Candidatus Berkiella cookevillensis]
MEQNMTGQYEHWKLDIDNQDIAWLTLDRSDSAVNSLNEPVLREFDHILNLLGQKKQAKAVIIQSGKKTGFIVGADISQFKQLSSADEATQLIKKGQEIFNKLENLPIPTIALISGFCLGGGLELALACTYRIAEDSGKTKLGLPEVKLGIHPGWGGTVRLPKLTGAMTAMDIILTGKNLRPKVAKKLGVVHEAVPKRLLKQAALVYALNPPKQSKPSLFIKLQNVQWVRPILGKLFRAQLKKKIKEKHYPAPFKVVKNWINYNVYADKAMHKEAESIGSLLVSDTSKNLVKVFFMQEKLKGLARGVDFSVNHVHVVGAGVMGGDIAAWCAIKGLKVTLQDQSPQFIGGAIKRAYDLAQKILKEKHLVQAAMDRLNPDVEGYGIAHADVIIEAITEKLEAKQNLFKMLEEQAKPEAILATNTSTIPLEEISSVLKKPGRLVGIHFFNPVSKMPLVEVVHGKNTVQRVIENAVYFVKKIDKLPLPVKSSPGFLVNRILFPYMLEAVALLEEGISGPMIDKAAVDFGMPMGPIELADTVGLDVCLNALEKMSGFLDIKVPEKLRDYVKRGDLGRKTGKGFYHYKNGKCQKPKISKSESMPSDTTDRLMFRLLNEAVACLREGIVENSELLDAGCIFGFGFAPFRGGPMNYIRNQGEERMLKQLEDLESRYGNRFAADEGWQKSGAVA